MIDEQNADDPGVRNPGVPTRHVREEQVEGQVRRSPKYGVFLGMGAAFGILLALILTFAFDGTLLPDATTGISYSQGQVFGFLTLICVAIGVTVFGCIALVFDRVLSRRVQNVRVDHESVSD